MSRVHPIVAAALGASLLAAPAHGASFIRADANQNGMVEIADPIRIFGYLFLGDPTPRCLDAADSNDNGTIDISDGIYILSFLFTGGPPPPPPYPGAGPDPSDDDLGCDAPGACPGITNSLGMRLVPIPAGSFLMGSPDDERGRYFVEGPVHRVHLTRGFHLGAKEVTQGEFESVMGYNPSSFHGGPHGVDPDRPVESVDWTEADEFCRRLSQIEGRTYRLPTEAEWEYASRAGTRMRFSFGDALECDDACGPCPEADGLVWWCANSEGTTRPVGTRAANPWCLFDMEGNVREWCLDWVSRYTADEATDPTGGPPPAPGEEGEKAIRGGAFDLGLRFARCAMRFDLSTEHRFEFLGFRVVLEEEPR